MWVQLKAKKHIVVMGKQKTYNSGDWVDVGKFLALRWIEDDTAHIPNQQINNEYVDYTAGVVTVGKEIDISTRKKIESAINHLSFAQLDKPQLLFSENLIYYPSFSKIRPELIGVGFRWLQSFEIVAPMFDYKILACHIGTKEDREFTKDIIKELRIPVYDNRFMFVRRSEKTKALIETFNEFNKQLTEPKLALICAIYEHKPIMLPTPTTWLDKDR